MAGKHVPHPARVLERLASVATCDRYHTTVQSIPNSAFPLKPQKLLSQKGRKERSSVTTPLSLSSIMSAYVVLGAGGGVGLECVKRLAAVGKTPIRAVVRKPAKYKDAFPAGVEVVPGDVSDKASLEGALKGAKAIIFAAAGRGYWSADPVDFKGLAAVADIAQSMGAHVVVVTSMLVTPKNRFNPIRILLNNIRWGLMDNKWKGEEALRASGASYTIVRPGHLGTGTGGQAQIVTAQGDSLQSAKLIERADVAAVCVAALDAPAAKRVTVEVFSKPSRGLAKDVYEKQLQEMWTALKPDATQPTADKPAATSAGGVGTTTASTTYAAKAAMAGDVAEAAHDADVPPVMKDAGAKPEQAAPAAMPQFAS